MSENKNESRHQIIELSLGAAWLVGSAAALQLLDQILGRTALGTALVGAMLVDFTAGRAGVRWGASGAGRSTLRLAVGACLALMVFGVVLAISVASHWIENRGEGVHPSYALLFAIGRASAMGVRDELLYRGIPLAVAARAGISGPLARVFAALAGGAAIALVPAATPGAVALAVGSGWFFAALWEKDRGPWVAIGAHTMWALLLGSLLHGGLFDIDWIGGTNLAIDASAAGAPAWVGALVLTAAGFAVRYLPSTPFGALAIREP